MALARARRARHRLQARGDRYRGRAGDRLRRCSRAHPASGDALAPPLLQLGEALAPAVAAERAGIALNPDDIESRVGQLRRAGYTVVVEGAGGVMVPLAWDYTALDLAAACDLDAVVVARAGLGTLNHVAMTVMILRSREIPIRGSRSERPCRIARSRRSDQSGRARAYAPRRPHRGSPAAPVGQSDRRYCGDRRSASVGRVSELQDPPYIGRPAVHIVARSGRAKRDVCAQK